MITWTSLFVALVLSCLSVITTAESAQAPAGHGAHPTTQHRDVVLLQEGAMYMDSIEDTRLFGDYVSIQGLEKSDGGKGMELYATKEGPKMAEIGPKTDDFMKTAVWKFKKGLSRDDCVSIEPLMTPGMYLRAQKVEVPINPPEMPAAAPAEKPEKEQNVIRDIGESVDSKGIFNSLFLPGPHGATAVPYSEVQGVNHDVRESIAVKQEASVTAPTKTVMTVVVAKNDDSLSFLKDATWCVRNPRKPATSPGLQGVAFESMGMPGFFLIRKMGGLVGVDLGHEAANAAAITFQLAPPGFEICPQNCHNHGKCRDVDAKKGTGKCKCHPGYADANCGVREGWPIMDSKTGAMPENRALVQAMQAALSYNGMPQKFDGNWSASLSDGVEKMTSAKFPTLLSFFITPGIQWETILTPIKAEKGWGKSAGQENVVKAIQLLLNRRFNYELGDKPEGAFERKVSGQFDDKTFKAVKNFQARFGLKTSGIVGLDEWNKMIATLPALQAMWPLEESYKLYPDEQVYFIQDFRKSFTGNCRLHGHYKWSDDLPNNIMANQYSDHHGHVRTDKKSLYFEFKKVHQGGYAECKDMKGQFDGARQFGVEMFFNPSTISQKGTLFSACDKSMNGPYLEYSGTRITFSISGQSSVQGIASMPENTWHYVAATYNGTTMSLFLDGKLLKQKTASEASIPWVSRTDPSLQVAPVIGGFSGDTRYRRFWGRLNNVYLSRVALTLKTLSVPGNGVKNMSPVPKPKLDEQTVKYSYQPSSPKGPKSWSTANKAWKKCAGSSQSPIDLPPAVADPIAKNQVLATPAKHLKYVSMTYVSAKASVIAAGAQIGMRLLNGGKLVLNSDSFEARQALFHTPSEHLINGLPTEMEMEILHIFVKNGNKTAANNATQAIVSVLFQRGPEMPALKDFMETIGKKKAGEGIGNFDLTDVIPFDPGFLVYPGSLSYPPCTEGATRIVIDKPITASMEQIQAIKDIVGNNARPVQNRGVRKVHRIGVDTLSLIE